MKPPRAGSAGLPPGTALAADRDISTYADGCVLLGGSPRRVLRLTPAGAAVARDLLAGQPVHDATSAALARRLVDAGLATPRPPASRPEMSLAVVIPAYGAAGLAHCLRTLRSSDPGRSLPVVVVDDASPDGDEIATIATAHHATLVRRAVNGGPGAARNDGLDATTAEVVAFVDSDAAVSASALLPLAARLTDPALAAVAPRIRPQPGRPGLLSRFADVASPLDLGPRSGPVRPGAVLGYVPSTVLVVRRSALLAVDGFSASMRVGEDVDLVWRLAAAGYAIAYAADVHAQHLEPTTWTRWLRRRASYGTSAGLLAARHRNGAARTLVPPVLPVLAVLTALAGRPRAGAAVALAATLPSTRRLIHAGVPAPAAASIATRAMAAAFVPTARWLTQLWWPLPLAALVAGPSRSSRSIAAAVLAAPALTHGPFLAPAVLADDLAYGAGVWRGCLRERVAQPLLPRRKSPPAG